MGNPLMPVKLPYRQLKRGLFVLLAGFVLFVLYVEIVNRNSKNMTYRQKVMKAVYPALMWFNTLTGKKAGKVTAGTQPPVSFYTLQATRINGENMDFSSLQGKKVLIVNTASDCGYTGQYGELQQLADRYSNELAVLAFPANDFKEQEKGDDTTIAAFCKANYGVTFPLMQKTSVIQSAQQHPVYQWLTDSTKNGWNNQQPGWNFTKYLVDEEGKLVAYFPATVSPLSRDVLNAMKLK